MDWIEEEAAHYLGERSITTSSKFPGKWAYDPLLGVIAYQPKSVSIATLQSEIGVGKKRAEDGNENHPQWLRFKVVGLLSKDKDSQNATRVIGLELRFVPDSNAVE